MGNLLAWRAPTSTADRTAYFRDITNHPGLDGLIARAISIGTTLISELRCDVHLFGTRELPNFHAERASGFSQYTCFPSSIAWRTGWK